MRYLGSKTLLLDSIYDLIGECEGGVFCDPFGGIGTVGAYMKSKGLKVISGDILNFAYFFQSVLVGYEKDCSFEVLKKNIGFSDIYEMERYLSAIRSDDGWVERYYARDRAFFTKENAAHVQGCIDSIKRWRECGMLNEREYISLIASLINSFDKVANTAGTYYAYLKHFDRKALKPFRFKLLHTVEGKGCHSYRKDANTLVKETKCDILYIDPPYNERNYSRYYHLPETISLGIEPIPSGKSGMYQKHNVKSDYNCKNKAHEAFADLISSARAKCIIFHYTDNGLIDIGIARDILKERGHIEETFFKSRGYTTTDNDRDSTHHIIKVKI